MENTKKSFVIRTFGRIHGKKLSTRQQQLVDKLLPKLQPTNIANGAILEIGFGAGEHILHLAKTFPAQEIIGAEPFINGVASLLSHMTDAHKNIKIWPDDIRKLLADNNCKFSAIYVLHPDPWPKARHEKRRLLSVEFLNEIGARLSPGGRIIIGTDHTDYFNWVLEQVAKTKLKIINSDFTIPPEYGLDTRYQRKNKFGSERPVYLVLGNK